MPAHKKGFTLIELLVVISILAILSVIGFTVFSNVQKSARDAKRRGDIDAITKALEVNKTTSGYLPIDPSWFAGGEIPHDPKTSAVVAVSPGCGDPAVADGYTNRCWYCLQNTSTEIGYCNGSDNYLSATVQFDSYAKTAWTICANLETGSPAYYCKSSQQ